MRRKPSLALAGVATALAALTLSAAPASAARSCDQVANPGPGAAQRLVDSLEPGQVGCLHGGSYTGNVKVATRGITLTRFGSEHALVRGRFWIARGEPRHLLGPRSLHVALHRRVRELNP